MRPQAQVSTLYRLPVLGKGSSQIESQTGYILRLALEHFLYPYGLLKEIIIPYLNEELQLKSEDAKLNRLTSSWFKEMSVTLNSLNPNTKLWSSVLEGLNSYLGLDKLTMLVWDKTISSRALIKPFYSWCAACYEDMRLNAEEVYNPLIWAINGTGLCSKHKQFLLERCFYSDCGCRILALSPRGIPGFCPSCHRWLGRYTSVQNKDLPKDGLEFVTAVEELLIQGQVSTFKPSPGIVGITINRYIEEKLSNNANAFAKLVGVNHKTAYLWRANSQLPTLGNLYKICKAMGTTMVDMVSGSTLKNMLLLPMPAIIPDKRLPQKSYRPFKYNEMRSFLRLGLKIQPPKSMRQLARSINYDPSFIAKKFPLLSRAITNRYKAYLQRNKKFAEEKCFEELQVVVQKLQSSGIYPSHRRLRVHFNGQFRNPNLRKYRLALLTNRA